LNGGFPLDPAIVLVARLALGLLFLSTALHKIRALPSFRATLSDYRVIPPPVAAPASLVLVAAELSVGCALLVPLAPGAIQRVALGGALALLLLYSAAIAVNLGRGRRHIDCGCTGPAARQPLSEGLLVRNLALMAAAGLAVLPAGTRPLGAIDAVTVAGSVTVLAALYTSSNRLMASAPASRRLRGAS
jgi:uncharacterized membrane protein YphA (DoxX/SURF4 family)